MYLKSLVLKGFKSFADRSVLSLEPGITAVVGPNGSGKSNISDAVLWVLGERNAKNLRGQAMEDVIFAGSSARKGTGLAEVDLVLDNSDGTLPIDFSEVSLTRRMYRSGESEYLINGTVARRMDVLEILHDTGLGTGTHSIISQGSLDSILQSKPEDRRSLIEEAAGVLKHKQRKAKSERKLEHMDQHLTRVKDVVAEVERQLGPLERKAKRALAYQGLATELADLTLALAVDDLRVLQRAWDEAVAREKALDEELEQKRTAITQVEKRAEELQERIRRDGTDAGELAKHHRRASSAVERIESATLLLREKRRAAQDYEADLRITLEANKEKRAQADSDRVSAASQLAEVHAERARADEAVARLTQERAQAAEKRRTLEREVEELTALRRSQERERDEAKREQAATQEALANGLAHAKLIDGHSKELAIQLERAQTDHAERAAIVRERTDALAALEERERVARERVGASFSAREAARVALDEAQDAERLLASQIKGIEEVERASQAAGPALAWLLEQEGSLTAGLAPLSHAVSAPEGLEALVERLLGSDLSALLVDDARSAHAVVEALVERGEAGDVSLVLRVDAATRPALAQAATHRLIDELSYPAEAARAVEALLGDVVVCESLSDAFAAHERDTKGLRFATTSGCVVWPSGKVWVLGAPDNEGEGVLARHRRLEELRALLSEATQTRAAAQAASAQAEDFYRSAQTESLKLSQDLAELRGGAQAAAADVEQAENKLAAVRRELEDVERQRAEAERTVSDARPNVEELAARVTALEGAREKSREALAAKQDAVVPLRKEAGRLNDALNEAKLKAATLVERETYTSRVADARVREIEQIDAADADAGENLVRKVVAQERIEPLLALLDELSDSARCRTRNLEEAASAAQDATSGMHHAANEARAASRAAHDAFDEANARMGQARVDKGRLELQVDAAVNAIVHDCKTPLDHALGLPSLEDRGTTEDQAFKLRRRIANMGTINPDAADEYERLRGRYDYLAAQLADLDSARRSLMKIVRVIDARMKDDFIRTYEAVSRNFSEIFAVLFPGGSAELTLVDPDDLETTGVEVTAQPRGKRITKMMLMSGGEKSLTALALLFAVYRIRTTPFYILDEVEAALDDSNLRRLTMYLESLRDSTQLIMITHQRRTMEMADVLFGVSMQADGVTKVVGQRLENALRHAE
ncbi:chromosome segregation protein SMC [Gordonibacter sp.]|uniref:chromosome segregation protein SMC n=1 Tax=Gordonibacter sp. TaxID=1968902 RepID=UPI002FCAA1E7